MGAGGAVAEGWCGGLRLECGSGAGELALAICALQCSAAACVRRQRLLAHEPDDSTASLAAGTGRALGRWGRPGH